MRDYYLCETYLSVSFYIVEIVSSLLNIFGEIGRWSPFTLTVIADENLPARLQPLVE